MSFSLSSVEPGVVLSLRGRLIVRRSTPCSKDPLESDRLRSVRRWPDERVDDGGEANEFDEVDANDVDAIESFGEWWFSNIVGAESPDVQSPGPWLISIEDKQSWSLLILSSEHELLQK